MTPIETTVAGWMVGVLSGSDQSNLTEFAIKHRITEGYASKLPERIAKRVKARLSGSPKQNNSGK